ncbi:hypothetical protein [Kitasatospora sp. MBT66]|uniref:hypothetical protein n=1 Tax=Kitasatospora sp. MBT66 TaxID=1444769 RepID=UPI0005B8C109|nr:hypothetical protein [Kitasatospora sp. MBT66]
MVSPNTTSKTAMLKKSFAEFFELKDYVAKLTHEAEHINSINLKVGGNDEIGKQYHTQVDDGTKNLYELLLKIGSTVGSVGENGELLAVTLDKAGDHANDLANGF